MIKISLGMFGRIVLAILGGVAKVAVMMTFYRALVCERFWGNLRPFRLR